jgi:hypothetical protein
MLRSREIKLERFPSCGGMVLETELQERLKCFNLVSEPKSYGRMEKSLKVKGFFFFFKSLKAKLNDANQVFFLNQK